MTDKPYRSLENTIREQARKAMQDKLDARMKLTTKVMEQPKPEPLKEETEIEEVSKDTLSSYVDKAHQDVKQRLNNQAVKPTEKNAKTIKNRYKGTYKAVDKLAKEDTEIEVNELAPGTSNNIDTSAKLDSQRKRLQAQKQAILQQQQKQKQAKAAQDAKDRAMEQDELKKAQMKEAELDERVHFGHVHNYDRATKLINLHTRLYNRLAAAGDIRNAEKHRKKAVEYKRIQYQAKDNPGKLPAV